MERRGKCSRCPQGPSALISKLQGCQQWELHSKGKVDMEDTGVMEALGALLRVLLPIRFCSPRKPVECRSWHDALCSLSVWGVADRLKRRTLEWEKAS